MKERKEAVRTDGRKGREDKTGGKEGGMRQREKKGGRER